MFQSGADRRIVQCMVVRPEWSGAREGVSGVHDRCEDEQARTREGTERVILNSLKNGPPFISQRWAGISLLSLKGVLFHRSCDTCNAPVCAE